MIAQTDIAADIGNVHYSGVNRSGVARAGGDGPAAASGYTVDTLTGSLATHILKIRSAVKEKKVYAIQ
jgi:hypothetical protein